MSSKSLLITKFLKTELHNKHIGDFTTELAHVRQLRFIEERYFELFLIDTEGRRSVRPVIRGIYFAGRGRWVKPWLEISYLPLVRFKHRFNRTHEIDIADSEYEERLLRLVADMLPPGGRLMVEYSAKDHPETVKALEAGAPPVLTKLGYLLWKTGFTSFKDWYFAEGWMEGNTKLQGEKPLDDASQARQLKKLISEVKKFAEGDRKVEGLAVHPKHMYEELLQKEKPA